MVGRIKSGFFNPYFSIASWMGCGTIKTWWSDQGLFPSWPYMMKGKQSRNLIKMAFILWACKLVYLEWDDSYLVAYSLYSARDVSPRARWAQILWANDISLAPVVPCGYFFVLRLILRIRAILRPLQLPSCHVLSLFPQPNTAQNLTDWLFLSLWTYPLGTIWKVYSCWNINYFFPE